MKKVSNLIFDLTTPKVHVCGLADHEDGNAYEVVCVYVYTTTAFTTALQMLNDFADHVLILSDEDYTDHPHTYNDLAPYSICISKGAHA